MKGNLIDLSFGRNNRQRITVEVLGDFREDYDRLKDEPVRVEIKKFRNTRSRDANAYFHVLVNKIAEVQGLGNDEIKRQLVQEYGALARDEDGCTIGFKLPASVNPNILYPYTKVFDEREENGKLFKCYLVYKPTHELDTKEMARLIDGTIYVAKDMGIETETPEQIARYKEEWGHR